MKATRTGMSKQNEPITQRRRRYRIHANLKKKGNTVHSRDRMVIKRTDELTSIENQWIKELINLGYAVSNSLFNH